MPIAQTETSFDAADRTPSAAKILQFGKRLQAKTGAMGEWAQDRAVKVRETVERRPIATAGVSAGAAFVGGLAIGLLLAGRIAGLKSSARSLPTPSLPHDLLSRARDFIPSDLAARIQRRF